MARRDGAAAAELALLVPVIALVLLGTIEFGRLLHDYNVIAKGVRDAARYLSRLEADACSGGSWAPQSGTAIAETQNMATRGAPTGGTQRIASFTNASVSVTTNCISRAGLSGVYNGTTDIRIAEVQATVTHSFIFGEYVLPGLPTLTLTVTHREPHIGD